MGFVRAYRPGDELELAPRLRTADLREIELFSPGRDPVDVLQEGAEYSVPSCTIVGNRGHLAGMFGVVPGDSGFGKIWLLGTDELVSHPLKQQFINEVPAYLSNLERLYTALGNVIDTRNTVHIKWLRRLGFTFIRREATYLEFIKLCVNQ